MSEQQFNYVSPGVYTREIDNTGRPKQSTKRGPVIITRTEKGPEIPQTVNSKAEFISKYGNPVPGGVGGDTLFEEALANHGTIRELENVEKAQQASRKLASRRAGRRPDKTAASVTMRPEGEREGTSASSSVGIGQVTV